MTKSATKEFVRACGWESDYPKAKKLLMQGQVDINCNYIDKPGEALWDACYHGLTKQAKMIIEHKDFDPSIGKINTSLNYAAKNGFIDIVIMLLTNERINFEHSALLTAIQSAVKFDRELSFQVLFEYCLNDQIDLSIERNKIFKVAVYQENHSIAKYLLKDGSILAQAYRDGMLDLYFTEKEIQQQKFNSPEFFF